jgi:hypothetical protein
MSTTLTVKLNGIALVHHAAPFWNVYLPFDDCHQVFFGFFNGDHNMPVKGSGNRIEITARNVDGSPVGPPTPGKNYAELIDLTTDFAHKYGVYLKKDWPDGTVFMSLNGGIYSVTLTPNEYSLHKTSGPDVPLGVVGFQGTFEIVADEFVVQITGEKPMTFKDPTTIYIDNDCAVVDETEPGVFIPPTNEDFHMLYDSIVRDKNVPGLQFTIVPTGPQIPDLPCNNVKVSVLLGVEP